MDRYLLRHHARKIAINKTTDEFTSELIPYASMNVWWITVDDKAFTYNLRRIGTDRVFSVSFDLSEVVENPESPWGWKD